MQCTGLAKVSQMHHYATASYVPLAPVSAAPVPGPRSRRHNMALSAVLCSRTRPVTTYNPTIRPTPTSTTTPSMEPITAPASWPGVMFAPPPDGRLEGLAEGVGLAEAVELGVGDGLVVGTAEHACAVRNTKVWEHVWFTSADALTSKAGVAAGSHRNSYTTRYGSCSPVSGLKPQNTGSS